MNLDWGGPTEVDGDSGYPRFMAKRSNTTRLFLLLVENKSWVFFFIGIECGFAPITNWLLFSENKEIRNSKGSSFCVGFDQRNKRLFLLCFGFRWIQSEIYKFAPNTDRWGRFRDHFCLVQGIYILRRQQSLSSIEINRIPIHSL